MWCHERKRLRRTAVHAGATCTFLAVLSFAGSAAAIDAPPPSLKISGKAAFAVEARALGEGFEVSAVLKDEVGRPLSNAEVRIVATGSATATLHRCGAPRADPEAELLLGTDGAGRLCVWVIRMPRGALELSYQDPRGYFERARRTVQLPESVTSSFEVGFDPPLSALSLDQPTQEVGVLARAPAGRPPPEAAELVLSLAVDGSERELGRAPLEGLGEVHRITLSADGLGPPGPARLIARLVARGDAELASATLAVMRRATVHLSLAKEIEAGVTPGASFDVRAASALGAVPVGIVEAHSRGLSIAAAPVRGGTATLALPSAASGMLGSAMTLEYVGAGAGWVPGAAVELKVLPAGPAYGRYALWIAAAAFAAMAVVLSWRRPPRPRPAAVPVPPRVRASVEVLEAFGAGGGYRGFVRDAHEGFGISPAVVSFIGPGPQRPVLLQLRTGAQGAFEVEGTAFPNETRVEVTAPFHATLSAPLPGPGVIELSLISRRRALLDRLVRWAERRGRPWSRPVGEPTPSHVASVAAAEAEPNVERWARGLEHLAFGPTPPDAASEQAAGVTEDPKVRQESGID